MNNWIAYISLAVVGLLTAVAVGGVLYGLVLYFAGPQARVRARVKRFVSNPSHDESAAADSRERQRATMFADLDSRWESRTLFKTISDDLESADLKITATELVLVQVVTGLAVGLLLAVLAPIIWLLLFPVGVLIGIYAVRAYLRYLGARRVARFEDQLPNNLSILASSVRGGFSLFQALQLIAREAEEPAKTEFTRVIQEISLGNTTGTALEGLSKRIPTEDVDILVTAITMQQQTGGNLTHVLDVVASTIRERHRVKRDINTLTAQQRFSSIILAALPFLLGAVLFAISPTYISGLFQPGWVLCLPIGAVVMSVVGFLVMRRLAEIDV